MTQIGYARLLPRFKGLLVDASIYLAATLAMLFALDTALGADAAGAIFAAWAIACLLYEPILVSVRGGTLGHSALNLRVVPDEHDGNLSFIRAVARTLIKGIVGSVSLLFMALTQRRQALHDIATRSTVQSRDRDTAQSENFAPAREEPVGAIDVSVVRRVLVIVGYFFGAALLGMALDIAVTSDACEFYGECSRREDLWLTFTAYAWLIAGAVLVVWGWKGRLYGARAGRSRSADKNGR